MGDGDFEKWMDEYEPTWRSSNTRSKEFWRAIWDAAQKAVRDKAAKNEAVNDGE